LTPVVGPDFAYGFLVNSVNEHGAFYSGLKFELSAGEQAGTTQQGGAMMSHASSIWQGRKKVAWLVMASLTSISFQGCTNEEVAIAAGVVGIAAGAIAIGAAASKKGSDGPTQHYHHHYHHHRPGHYYGYGGYYYPVRPYPPGYYRPWRISDQMSTQSLGLSGGLTDAAVLRERQNFIADFAKSFEIPEASAARLINAFDALRAGNALAFSALGLSSADFRKLASLQMPSVDGLATLAGQLGLTQVETTEIFSTLISYAKIDLQNSDGRIWRDCRATGAWRTPQVKLCTSRTQAGCSVETGATLCAPVPLDSASI
jgi:hypothetical protein